MEFIREERKLIHKVDKKLYYQPKDLKIELLQALISIMVVMPIRADVKHDWHMVEKKVSRLQKGWNIYSPQRCQWEVEPEELQIRINFFEYKLLELEHKNHAYGVKCLHQVIFTVLNGFCNSSRYDSKDRALIKLTFETCNEIFQKVLRIQEHTSFFLTLFETCFGTKVPRDKYDIKLLHKLFGDELLTTL